MSAHATSTSQCLLVAFAVSATVGLRAMAACCAEPGAAVPLADALRVIQANEEAIRSLEYDITNDSGRAASAEQPLVIVEKLPGYGRGHVRFEPHSGRFYYEGAGAWLSSNEAGEITEWGHREMLTSDGERFLKWNRNADAVGNPVPPAADDVSKFAEGIIAPAEDVDEHIQHEGFVEVYGGTTGLVNMPPLFWTVLESPLKLSELMQRQAERKFKVTVGDVGEGYWEIRIPIMFPENDVAFYLRLQYDTRSGAVTETEWATGNPLVPFQRSLAELQEVDGFWLPKTVRQVMLPPNPPIVGLLTYSNLKVNQEFGPQDFTLAFPPGVRLTDYIDHKYYVTGQEPEDERQAIGEFIRRTGLPGPAGPWQLDQPSRWTWQVIAFTLSTLLLVGCGVYTLLRNRRAARLLIYLAAGLSTGGWNAADAAQPSKAVPLEVTGQCGYRVAVFALETFGLKLDAARLAGEFQPTPAGISLAELRDALRARGLDVQARSASVAATCAGTPTGDARNRASLCMFSLGCLN